jgi:uncharacterized membrane protein YccC
MIGVGIVLGYLGYSIASTATGSEIISIVVGAALFIMGVVLANQFLSVATAILGGLLLFDVLTYLGMGFVISAIAGIVVAAVGAWVQLMETRYLARRRTVRTTTTTTHGPESDETTTTTQTENL